MTEEELQKLYMEFQMLHNNIKQLEKQNEVLEKQLMELLMANQSLDDMKKAKKGTEILVPLSSGIYAKAELKDNENFIVNVGSNITVNKNLESTKKVIENQIDEMQALQKSLVDELQKNTVKAALMEKEINKIGSTLKNK
ncbi:prefoldin subunit alpha [Candidatus Woesearchaeota archaeon]|nr:prefoldin subunit alpha [Candidatus Woesearchaeota archaeon]|tara:strand:+ start:4180 stop:4599 length:420 start_codon:yes stop_codon:yes gene_type:complete